MHLNGLASRQRLTLSDRDPSALGHHAIPYGAQDEFTVAAIAPTAIKFSAYPTQPAMTVSRNPSWVPILLRKLPE